PLPALARGELDLVITSDPQDISGLTYVPLFTYEAVLAISNQHPLGSRSFVEPGDLAGETLICYPVERDRLDIFSRLLDPAGIGPAAAPKAERSIMRMPRVAAARGGRCRPTGATSDYLKRGDVRARRLGRAGLFGTLAAAVREAMRGMPYMQDLLLTA